MIRDVCKKSIWRWLFFRSGRGVFRGGLGVDVPSVFYWPVVLRPNVVVDQQCGFSRSDDIQLKYIYISYKIREYCEKKIVENMICGNFLSVWCFKDDLNEMENFMMVEKWDKKNEKFRACLV